MKTKENIINKLEKNSAKNNKKYIFYKLSPCGISLIVLVITIIVIIILATAIIVNIVGNNPISEANKARFESDRDSMQSVFTNTVAKVMAKNQGTIDIKAGALNEVTSGVNSSIGDAIYTLSNPIEEKNKNGKIVFDKKENEENVYYTGKQLPIYKVGKTTWYVDEEGIISLEVGDKIYGNGKIVKSIKIKAEVIESEEYIKNKAKVRIEVIYEGKLENIIFNKETITNFEKEEKRYIVEREVTENGIYEIEANGENGAKEKISIEVNEIENLNNNIQIKTVVMPSSDYVKATIGIEITYSGEVESIKVNGENIAVPSKTGGKYVVNKEVMENGEYKVEVRSKDGTVNKVVVKVVDITEDMDIWNRADMERFRDRVNSGRTFQGKIVRVRANINLGGSSTNRWSPVGYYVNDKDWKVFKGTFEGNNYTISNLYIDSTSQTQGLFGYATNAIINNVVISGNVKGGKNTGGLVGGMIGTINNCKSTVTVVGNGESVGGIVGYFEGVITSSTNATNSVTGVNYVGGIVGYSKGEMSNCINNSNITSSGNGVGGIVGVKDGGLMTSCINNGTVTGYGNDTVGGIAGHNGSKMSNCTNNRSVTGTYSVGGIAGYNTGEISNCTNNRTYGPYTNTIYGKTDKTGGIVGVTTANIIRCSNYAIVQGTNEYAGGIAGLTTSTSTISLCFNMGEVKINTWNVGGITGWNDGPIYYCYNRGNITCSGYYGPYNGSWAGGITGTAENNIHYCYNTGSVYSYARATGGISGGGGDVSMSIYKTYNAGSYSQTTGGMIGPMIGDNKGNCSVQNSYQVSINDLKSWNTTTITNMLSTNYTKDTKNINGGFPILKWQN